MVVIISQLPRLLGVTVRADDTLRRAIETVTGLGQTSLQTFVVGAMCLALVTVAAAWRLGAPAHSSRSWGLPSRWRSSFDTGDRPGPRRAAGGDPGLHIPSVTSADVWALLPISVVIALLAAADTIVSSRAFAQRNRYDVESNRDLIGLGAANLASGLSGGITTSASAARTAVVEMVGGRSQLASVAAAGVMVIVLLFLTAVGKRSDGRAAAVVIGAVLRLIEVRSLRPVADPTKRVPDRAYDRIRRRGRRAPRRDRDRSRAHPRRLRRSKVRRRRYAPGLRDERKAGALAPAVGSPTAPVYRFTEPCTSPTRGGSGTARFGSSKADRELGA